MRICKECKIEKELTHYYLCDKKTMRYSITCKLCTQKRNKYRYLSYNELMINDILGLIQEKYIEGSSQEVVMAMSSLLLDLKRQYLLES